MEMFNVVVERDATVPAKVPDAQLEFWGKFYRLNPVLGAQGISFESFLNFAVRNGALFEKLRHHRNHRHGRSSGFSAALKGGAR